MLGYFRALLTGRMLDPEWLTEMFNELDERNHDGGAGIERQEPHLPIGSRGSLDARPRTGQQDNKASTHGSTLDAIAEAELLRATCEDVSSGCIYSAYNRSAGRLLYAIGVHRTYGEPCNRCISFRRGPRALILKSTPVATESQGRVTGQRQSRRLTSNTATG